jgi:peptidoglycan/xylan/chitin deacetylase (PgdA/CDA1 family)
MFEATEPFGLFDYLRVPYTPAPRRSERPPAMASLTVRGSLAGADLGWPSSSPAVRTALLPPALYRIEDIPFCARLAADDTVASLLSKAGGNWTAERPITDAAGIPVASVWREAHGSVFLPFDPWEALESYLTEGYLNAGRGPLRLAAQRALRHAYYRSRPLLPRGAQMALRRGYRHRQQRIAFPRFPFEPAFDDLVSLVVGLAAEVAGAPVPMIATWPAPHSWALVLTHDVETRVGYDNVRPVCDLEESLGFRSSWNLVPERDYEVDDLMLAALRRDGFEVGVHGLHHDGRDFDTRRHVEQRLPAIREYTRQWRAVGFRSPSTHRRWEWMQLLEFEYDSSYTDTAPYEPQAGGCCSWLPYQIGALVELPITLPQDHTLFELLGHRDESVWVDKADLLRSRGGMALVLTHPDYMVDPDVLRSYRRFLERFADDELAWRALPREVAAWWRRRAASRLEWVGDEWRIVGPAGSDGAVVYRGGVAGVPPGAGATSARTQSDAMVGGGP